LAHPCIEITVHARQAIPSAGQLALRDLDLRIESAASFPQALHAAMLGLADGDGNAELLPRLVRFVLEQSEMVANDGDLKAIEVNVVLATDLLSAQLCLHFQSFFQEAKIGVRGRQILLARSLQRRRRISLGRDGLEKAESQAGNAEASAWANHGIVPCTWS